VKDVSAVVQFVGMVRAGDDALTAMNAALGSVSKVASGMLSLRIMTPETAHRTSLQENRRADSRAVVNREALDVKNDV
jgi:predicted aconitase